MVRGPKLPKTSLVTAFHDHEGLHDLWWPPLVVVPPVVGEAVCPQNCPSQGSPPRATSWIVVMTTDHGKAHGVSLASWDMCQVRRSPGQGTTGTTTSRGALDESYRGT
uniref:Uncharacterized protein n=1 Tax=Solanum tuberosum TaxID=4113 RepID=M1DZE6_SOLTU